MSSHMSVRTLDFYIPYFLNNMYNLIFPFDNQSDRRCDSKQFYLRTFLNT